MKIVKADAKGRVTGFEPGQVYTLGDEDGRTVAKKLEPKVSQGAMMVRYRNRPTPEASVTFEIRDSVAGIALEVKQLREKYNAETLIVDTNGMGIALSDSLEHLGVDHTKLR